VTESENGTELALTREDIEGLLSRAREFVAGVREHLNAKPGASRSQ
jgi:hypothetical protein